MNNWYYVSCIIKIIPHCISGGKMKPVIKKIKSDKKSIFIELPARFLNKDLQVIIQIDEKKTEKILMTEKIKIDTKKWKFSRDEIYE